MDQIFVFAVEDAEAACWRAELGVVAPDKAAAVRRLREAGVRKSQFRNGLRPDRVMGLSEIALAGLRSGDFAIDSRGGVHRLR